MRVNESTLNTLVTYRPVKIFLTSISAVSSVISLSSDLSGTKKKKKQKPNNRILKHSLLNKRNKTKQTSKLTIKTTTKYWVIQIKQLFF